MLEEIMDLVHSVKQQTNNLQRPENLRSVLRKKGERPVRRAQINTYMTLLNGARDWNALVDLRTPLKHSIHNNLTDAYPKRVVV